MVTVNAMGDNCPIPVIKTKKAMQALTCLLYTSDAADEARV